ncbi:hypothetical protein JGU66_03125 [Myxococcaceae bacterium JPH2]|nr:hypothetical protein [Myxococcaceae bacterium JPH2]
MNRVLLWVACSSLMGCSLFRQPFRPEHAPVEEASRFEFPLGFPPGDHVLIPGTLAAAVQLAMDDFLPRGSTPHRGATADEVCLYQRDSYDTLAKLMSDEVVLVSFTPKKGACIQDGIALDLGATYAVDIRKWRILAVQR